MKKDTDTFHAGYQALKKSFVYTVKELEKARKKYKSFDDKWELQMLKGMINNL